MINFYFLLYTFILLYNTYIKYLLIKCYLLFSTIFTKFTGGKKYFYTWSKAGQYKMLNLNKMNEYVCIKLFISQYLTGNLFILTFKNVHYSL